MKLRVMAIWLACLLVPACASDPGTPGHPSQGEPARTERADARSFEQLAAAAEAGDAQAQSDLGFAYQMGHGVAIDHAAGQEWHRRAAQQGIVTSQAALGRCLLEGIGSRKQPHSGLYWLHKAALAGEPNAQVLLGETFLHGYGRSLVRADYEKAEKWLLAASRQGSARAKFDLATLDFERDSDETGVAWLREAVARDHAQAVALLASLTREGARGVKRDAAESLRLLEQAAELGDPAAQNEFGVALRDGLGIEAEPHRSFEWFERAAWANHTDAQFNFALAYLTGNGVDQDRVRAVAWLEVCRDETHREAIRKLGTARVGLSPADLAAAERAHQDIAASLADRATRTPVTW